MTVDRFARLASRLNRRQALARLAGLGAAVVAPGLLRVPGPPPARPQTPAQTLAQSPTQAVGGSADLLRPEIRPRADWGADLPVRGEVQVEDDVRFLLVHHTASTNDYAPEQVADQIRSFYRFHTGPEKGWPDVAYNFFVDRFGAIWEGREGSIAGPVRGDATGGSQGFALLCSLIGDYRTEPVPPEQQAGLIRLLAWLSERHGIDTTPGAQVGFVSRGSNRWPAGAEVTARTISGHREMSSTTCPGDAAFGLLDGPVPEAVTALRVSLVAPTSTTATPTTAPTTPTTASTTAPTAAPVPPSTTASPTPTSPDQAAAPSQGAIAGPAAGLGTGPVGAGDGTPTAVVIGAIGAAVAVAAAAYRRMARTTGLAGPSMAGRVGRQEGDATTGPTDEDRLPPPGRPGRT